MESHYEALGLSPDADDDAVRRAYRTLLKDYHPDQGGSREQFLRIKEAYERITGERAPASHEADGGAVPGRSVGDAPQPEPIGNPEDGRGLTVGGHYLTLSLTGLVRDAPLDDLFDAPVNDATERTVAFFEATNVDLRELPWRGSAATSFVGDDGFLYEGATLAAPPTDGLPSQWRGSSGDLEPGRTINAVVVAQEIPDDVAVEKVIYTQHVPYRESDGYADTERYLFEITPLIADRLDRVPFERA